MTWDFYLNFNAQLDNFVSAKKDKRSYENVTLKMTSSPHITIASLFLALSLKNVLGAINLTDLVISDYDFNDPDNDRVS